MLDRQAQGIQLLGVSQSQSERAADLAEFDAASQRNRAFIAAGAGTAALGAIGLVVSVSLGGRAQRRMAAQDTWSMFRVLKEGD
jgi:hypothetical protein